MKKYTFLIIVLIIFVIVANARSVYAGNLDIAISEILFDPVGTDTGLEYIVIKNFGATDIDMTGWDLYPDGIGYYTFPNFSLSAGKSVKILLRANGTDDESNVYHSAATSNMGNSSGSAALFSSTSHNKDTIISFIRYQKPGSTERKTWESTAASAGLWAAGTFVDVLSSTEGQSVVLTDISQKNSPQGWILAYPENNTSVSTEENADTNGNNASPSDLPQAAYSNPLPEQKIKSYAGKDITAIAGAGIIFVGYAEDVKGKPLDGARFLWNFGDGGVGEGKSVSHSYRFPGIYNVYMDSSVGVYSASDIVKVTIVESPLLISEIKPGADGWIEIKNNSARTIDISGLGIRNAGTSTFYVPPNTMILPWAEIVFGSSILRFSVADEGEAILLYSNGSILFKAPYKKLTLADNESLNWTETEWIIAKTTPGEKNNIAATTQKINGSSKQKTEMHADNVSQKTKINTNAKNTLPASDIDFSSEKNTNFSASLNDSVPKLSSYLWLAIGTGGGIVAGFLFLFLKKAWVRS